MCSARLHFFQSATRSRIGHAMLNLDPLITRSATAGRTATTDGYTRLRCRRSASYLTHDKNVASTQSQQTVCRCLSGSPRRFICDGWCSKTVAPSGQGWSEVTNAEPGQRALHAVHKPGAFLDQALALPIGPLGVLFGKRRYAHHAAMAPFPPQPAQKPALQQFGVQSVGLGPTMLPRYRDTRGMD